MGRRSAKHERTLVDLERAGKHFWKAWAEEQQRLRQRSEQLAVETFNPCPPPGDYRIERPAPPVFEPGGSADISPVHFELWASAYGL